MDRDRQHDFEQLNAFVDGELDVDARAAVASRAANDPEYARQLAALSRLKATLIRSIPAQVIALPQRPRRLRMRRAAAAVAASLALIAAVGLGWLSHDRQSRPTLDSALAWSLEAHRGWLPRESGTVQEAKLRAASAVPGTTVPDLSANGLALAYAGERKAPDGQDTLLVGYLGSRGCRLTMLVHRSATAAPAEPVVIETGPVLAALWQAGSLRYALLAEGMAAPRFRLIADAVRRASSERQPLDEEFRTALARNRADSPPCHT